VDSSNYPLYRVLALSARAECSAEQYRQIAQAAADVMDWTALPTHAEAHGMAPLVYRHLVAAGVTLPLSTKRELQGLSVRHRLANQVRTRVLIDILSAYESIGIRTMVLKGAALCHLIYPEPGLRPMRDLDLLVSPSDLLRAQRKLTELGFDAPLTVAGQNPNHRHLTSATRQVEGFMIGVEVHHNLFERGSSPILMSIDDLTSEPLSFSLGPGDIIAHTLGYEDTMWYLCQHLIESTNVLSSVGLIWVADVVSFAERYVAQIDWAKVRQQYPIVLSTLSLVHFLTPLSDSLVTHAGVELGRAPHGLWDDFRKSPRTPPETTTHEGYALTLRDAFFPSEWWLRLYFGIGSAHPVSWRHRIQHLLYLAARFRHVTRRHIRARNPNLQMSELE
jgi:Uncharacterised nucleotidyltransferase